jgi:PAS domain-containing protein
MMFGQNDHAPAQQQAGEPLGAWGRCRVRDPAELLQLLWRQLADAILLVEPTGAIADANPAAGALLGYSQNELCQMHL